MNKCLLRDTLLNNLSFIGSIFCSDNYNHFCFDHDGICIIDTSFQYYSKLISKINSYGSKVYVFGLFSANFFDDQKTNDILCFDERFWKPFRMELFLNKIEFYKNKIFYQNFAKQYGKKIRLSSILQIVRVDNIVIKFSPIEYKLFELLLFNNGELLSKNFLYSHLTHNNRFISQSAMYTLLSRVRKKLMQVSPILNLYHVYKKGYVLKINYSNCTPGQLMLPFNLIRT